MLLKKAKRAAPKGTDESKPRQRKASSPGSGVSRSGRAGESAEDGGESLSVAPIHGGHTPKPSLRRDLLAWFDRHKRALPWRQTRDPYAIWLSEVMLQQTQVQTVIPYWERFLARFPTVKDLAAAPLDDVLSLWRGLGYYSRARNLHRAAQEIAALPQFPRTAEALAQLPGFGRYTAGAVASIGFGEEAPIVDGNVARVFARVFVIEGLPGDRERERVLWATAEQWVRGDRPGDWNQALMELGALVCRPDAPACLLCPVRAHCGAQKQGRVSELPPARVRAARKKLELLVGVWRVGDKLLLARREGGGLFGGLWELPSIEASDDRVDLLRELLGDVAVGPEQARIRRTLTHRDLTLRLHSIEGRRSPSSLKGYDALRWTTPAEAEALGMSTAMQHALSAAVADDSSRSRQRGPRTAR